MKTIVLAVAASLVLTTAVPALAADNPATGRPAQLTQKLDDAGKDKAKGVAKDVAKKKGNLRANKSGAARGDIRSDQIHDLTKTR
jgi:hypothetical protein